MKLEYSSCNITICTGCVIFASSLIHCKSGWYACLCRSGHGLGLLVLCWCTALL